MLSSLTNVSVSPFLTVTALSENARPFCEIVFSAANATTDPLTNAATRATVISFMRLSPGAACSACGC